jgi:hypothetical protein
MSVAPLTLWAKNLAASMAHKVWEVNALSVQKRIPLSGNDFHDSLPAPILFSIWPFALPPGIVVTKAG